MNNLVFNFDPNIRWQQFAELCDLQPATIRKRLVDSGFSTACDSGRLRGQRALVECARLLERRISMERFREIWVSPFTPNLPVLDLLKQAKQQTATALLTNNSDIAREGLEARFPAELALLLPRLYSADLGYLKPDPRSFAAALDLLDLPATECLFIDVASPHTACAASLGFRTHTYTDANTLHEELRVQGLLP